MRRRDGLVEDVAAFCYSYNKGPVPELVKLTQVSNRLATMQPCTECLCASRGSGLRLSFSPEQYYNECNVNFISLYTEAVIELQHLYNLI